MQLKDMTDDQRALVTRLHAEACARGDFKYNDPFSDKRVSTELKHLDRGHCCRCGCRHCPYGYTPEAFNEPGQNTTLPTGSACSLETN